MNRREFFSGKGEAERRRVEFEQRLMSLPVRKQVEYMRSRNSSEAAKLLVTRLCLGTQASYDDVVEGIQDRGYGIFGTATGSVMGGMAGDKFGRVWSRAVGDHEKEGLLKREFSAGVFAFGIGMPSYALGNRADRNIQNAEGSLAFKSATAFVEGYFPRVVGILSQRPPREYEPFLRYLEGAILNQSLEMSGDGGFLAGYGIYKSTYEDLSSKSPKERAAQINSLYI